MKCKLHSYLVNLSHQEKKRLCHFLNGKDVEFVSGKLPSKGFMDSLVSILFEVNEWKDAEAFQKEVWRRWQKDKAFNMTLFSNQQSRLLPLLDIFLSKLGMEKSLLNKGEWESISIYERLQREIESDKALKRNEELWQSLEQGRFRTLKNLETMIQLVINRSFRKFPPGMIAPYHRNLDEGLELNEEYFYLSRIRLEIAYQPDSQGWPESSPVPENFLERNLLLAAFEYIRVLRQRGVWDISVVRKLQDVFSDSEFPYGSAEGREACLGFLNTGIWYSKKGGTQAKILEEALKPVLKGIQNLDPMVKMNVSLYENLCSIALLTGNLPLARQVAEGLSDRLTEEGIQTGSRNFALARVAQMEDKPAQALKLLKHSYSPKGSRKLRWYVIRVQLLGITGDWLALESEVEAFRKWLDYNSEVDGPEEIQNYLDWLSVIRRILNVKSGSKQAVAKINEDIQQCGLFQDYLKKLLGMVLDRSSLLAKETARPK